MYGIYLKVSHKIKINFKNTKFIVDTESTVVIQRLKNNPYLGTLIINRPNQRSKKRILDVHEVVCQLKEVSVLSIRVNAPSSA